MSKDFGRWLSTQCVPAPDVPAILSVDAPPDLMRTVEALEEELGERVRNLYPVDADIHRGFGYYEEVHRVLSAKQLPGEYVASSMWQHAHQLYWQIEAFKKNPDATMWHPV